MSAFNYLLLQTASTVLGATSLVFAVMTLDIMFALIAGLFFMAAFILVAVQTYYIER